MRRPGIVLLYVIATGWFASADTSLPVLTLSRQIQQLSPEEAKREYPVRLKGTVTFVDKTPGDMFIQDATGGVFVFVKNCRADVSLRAGQLVTVEGFTTPADYSPAITKGRIEVIGNGPMPEPKRVSAEPLAAGKNDGLWIETEGVVRSGEVKMGFLFLNVAAPNGTFLLITNDFAADWSRVLVDSKIVVRGVLGAIFNEKRQSVAFRVFVPGQRFIGIVAQAPSDSFALPLRSTLSVGQHHPQQDLDRRIRVQGTLLAVESQKNIFISDGRGSLQVEEYSGCGAQPGDLVNIVGFPASLDSRPGLQDAICRKMGRGIEYPAIPVTAEQVIPEAIFTDVSGYGMSAGTRYDMKTVSIEGTLLQSSPGPEGELWSLQQGKRNFTAKIPAGLPAGDIGGRYRLTGMCLLNYDHYHRARFFQILVRWPREIFLVARPRWWSVKLAVWIVGGLAFLFLLTLAWVSVLRKQVSRQTQDLRGANEALRRLSTMDALTGAANRRLFDETLQAEIARAHRSGEEVSLVMADIDYFKSINDISGHQHGDTCLIEIARALESVIQRETDLICRFGGEEFAIILPGTHQEGALAIAESMRRAVLRLGLPNPGAPWALLSISLGVTTFRTGSDDCAEQLVARADEALYEAKRRGRNRVCGGQSLRNLAETGPGLTKDDGVGRVARVVFH